ncbi:hypothetical protein EZV73_03595 [Acidaminobacter sp. JC074]|uniref:hypothetical protein n=1 Tax=Acidaminobacter sp. JC074 TaxID=2530199 RepID=UPI001F111AAA|nr:hypothetical protein [Acidaminobacter sp. JC074]MCH4886634.1 hypothetical protein [Acidaminobacter sp. JC074]
MEKQLENVVDDISIIKSVIEKTRRSFSGFSKIFLIWGCMYIVMSLINFIQGMNKEMTMSFYASYTFMIYLMPLVFFLLGAYVFYRVVKKQPLIGLERHLMVLWVLVIFLQVIRMRVVVENAGDTMMILRTSNLAIMAYGLSIALIMTGILTELKHLIHLGSLYIIIAFLHSYIGNFGLGYTIVELLDKLGYIIMPFTLLYVGVYLKRQSERG